MPTYRHAVLGGTFDHLHVGHLALLSTAFRAGRRVSIGLTTDRYLADHPKPVSGAIEPFEVRARNLRRWLAARYPPSRYRVVPLENRFGRSVEEGVGVLVVSVDTKAGGRAVNAERRRLGRDPVPLVVVPVVLADDLGPVSSRRVRAGEIDRDGRRRAPIRIGVALGHAGDRPPGERAVRAAFPSARVRFHGAAPAARRGTAALRARGLARSALADGDLGLGVLRSVRGGWRLVERSRTLELGVRVVPAGTPSDLERAILALLRPGRG